MLETKLFVPILRDNPVIRRQINTKFMAGAKCKLTLVSAPAGYGKTTAVVQWLNEYTKKCSWVSLDKNDNDSMRFLTYLTTALQKVDHNLGIGIKELLGSPQPPGFEILLEMLVNDLANSQEEIILVLDDYHLITNMNIHAGIGFLIDYKPPSCYLILTTREDPPLGLARLRAKNELVEIRAADLSFNKEEIEHFFYHAENLNLSENAIDVLTARTEGWISGLQLAALSLQGKDEPETEKFIKSFGGTYRYIIDYLMEEVLQGLPLEMRKFLSLTAVLERFCSSLCQAVTGCSSSTELIMQLEKAGLFVIPLDHNRIWYRYHHLFANVLSGELTLSERTRVLTQAAKWFEEQGLLEEGLKCALAANDWNLAARLLDEAAVLLFEHGEMTTIIEWTDQLPDGVLLNYLDLAVYKVWALFYTGHGDKSSELISLIEQRYPKLPGITSGRVTSVKGWINYSCFGPDGGKLADQALKYLVDNDSFKLMALILKGEYQRNQGDAAGAVLTFRKAWEVSNQADYSYSSLGALVALAVSLEYAGQRDEAEVLCQDAVNKFTDKREPIPLLGVVYTRLGALYYAANRLDLAHNYLQQGVDLCRKLSSDRIMGGEGKITLGNVQLVIGLMDLAQVLYTSGRRQDALNTVNETRELIKKIGLVPYISKIKVLEADLLLREGTVTEAAARLREFSQLEIRDEMNQDLEDGLLVLVRVYIAQQKYLEAMNLLAGLEKSAIRGGRQAGLIKIYILFAQAQHGYGCLPEALISMERALQMAEHGRYIRPFLDGGEVTLILLEHLRLSAPYFVEDVLTEFAKVQGENVNVSSDAAREANAKVSSGDIFRLNSIVSPEDRTENSHYLMKASDILEHLSEREIEILSLVARGLSNNEIASKLFITVGTTKWHLNNIFSKLGVNSRTKAVSLARELRLI